MYKITNLSRYSNILGLYPGKSKKLQHIDEKIRELQKKHLIHVEEIKTDPVVDTRAPKKKEEIVDTQSAVEEDKNIKGVEI